MQQKADKIQYSEEHKAVEWREVETNHGQVGGVGKMEKQQEEDLV